MPVPASASRRRWGSSSRVSSRWAQRSTSGASSAPRESSSIGRGSSESGCLRSVPRSRSRNSRASAVGLVLAATSVALLAGSGGRSISIFGIVLAAVAGFFWALYILLRVRVGQAFTGASGLAPAMALGAVLVAPWGILSAGHHLRDPQLVGAGVGVGLLSSALPWSLEIEAMRRLPSHVFGVVLSLEPGVAALVGFVFLHEPLRVRAWFAIALVVAASAGAAAGRRRSPPPRDV